MLEKIGINFLVLEKYNSIAPDLGASIGIFPNGFRILDQLGCFDAISKLVEGADGFELLEMKNEFGQTIQRLEKASEKIQHRIAYAPVFIDRQMIIQILYDNLRDKSTVVTGKGVQHVEQHPDHVRVQTTDGTMFTGELLVGADGIYSTVRKEMWRQADQARPGYFPLSDRTNTATEYCCIFGISKPTSKVPKCSSFNVMGRGHSYLVATGPNHRVYWFLFKKLSSVAYGIEDKYPRYTEDERDALAAEHADDVLNEELRFGELYANRTTATLQALPEVIFSKWHYGRIVTIGDAAHKLNPIGGQGGNSAIEDAAVLTNQLFKLAPTSEEDQAWTDNDISEALERTFSLRYDRVASLVKMSHDLQTLQALDSFFTRILAKFVIPHSSPVSVLDQFSSTARPAARLEMVEIPNRPHAELYDDEKPAKSVDSKRIFSFFAYGAFTLVSALVLGQLGAQGLHQIWKRCTIL
ncbi:FAD/NAD(P)-binding domain-containing protein [Phaeosphaeriaceae sp. SRC1lsM3a]|nr:FAD/NAD(P)-binding domain-containing protein [Stagonospora sp. SRC1lsM3a]